MDDHSDEQLAADVRIGLTAARELEIFAGRMARISGTFGQNESQEVQQLAAFHATSAVIDLIGNVSFIRALGLERPFVALCAALTDLICQSRVSGILAPIERGPPLPGRKPKHTVHGLFQARLAALLTILMESKEAPNKGIAANWIAAECRTVGYTHIGGQLITGARIANWRKDLQESVGREENAEYHHAVQSMRARPQPLTRAELRQHLSHLAMRLPPVALAGIDAEHPQKGE
jgi:hypothetical protein